MPALSIEAGPVHRTLHERGAGGATLVRERGWLGRVGLRWQPEGSAWSFHAALAGGDIDYAGRTQAGQPLSTTTRQAEAEGGVGWRFAASPAWGSATAGVGLLRHRRAIAGTATAGGITETSQFALGRVAWLGPRWPLASGEWQLRAAWGASLQHRLRVDYGGVFDASSLRAGRRHDLQLGVAFAPNREWQVDLAAMHAVVRASDPAPLSRNGTPAGTVRQPRIAIDDVALTLTRRF